ncbi:DivIVA domain-containing protein [Leifsonia poae]|uniref:DivIVA domain-containing protein n=1 Tax=Leifsonia poae TaxID=110933 RepID=UPI0027E0B20A|nr:DivIVA domain-containing protein [Leifsonia poae]
MALTPEDVVNKRFQPTKFREGYDQDEVDDFLDEVVVELRRLNQENEELKQRLVASDSRIAELQRSGGQSTGAPVAAAPAAGDSAELASLRQENEELKERLAAAPVAAAAVAAAPAYVAPENDPNSTNNLLQLARRLHEEHVKEGVEKRDALIAEGHATAARIVAEAESKQRAQITALDQERSQLENRIDGLRSFEREYREKLKGYIEGQLRELDTASVAASGGPATSAVAPQTSAPVSASSAGGPLGTGSVPTSSAPVSAIPSVPAPISATGDTSTGQNQTPQPPTFQGFGA